MLDDAEHEDEALGHRPPGTDRLAEGAAVTLILS